eukprot:gene7421-8207_t
MLPHEAEELLIRNETYISAIQRASVSLYHLGFEDLSLRSSVGDDDIMKAVIPNDNQVDFLDNIDKGLRYMTFAHLRRHHREKRLPRLKTVNATFNLEEARQIFPKPELKPNPFLHGQIPHYAKSTHRMQEWDEEERKCAIEKEEYQKRLNKLDKRYDIIKNGQKYVYNPMTGKLITIEEAARLKNKKDRSKSFRAPPNPTASLDGQEKMVFKGVILEKTSRYVDSLRKSIEEERKPKRHHEIPNALVEWPKHLLHIWPEYDLLEEGDVLLTIEHCHSCSQHDEHTHHKEEKYIEQAELVINVTKSIAEHYGIRFFALMKPIELPSALELSVERSINHKVIEASEYRIGAFEVQIAFKRFGYLSYTAHTLHSKLYTGHWPKISTLQRHFLQLLDQSGYEIVQALPDQFLDANTVYGMLGISTNNSGSGKIKKGIRRSISRSRSPISRLRSRSRSPSSGRQQLALGNALVDQKKEPKQQQQFNPMAIVLPPTGKTTSLSFSSKSPPSRPYSASTSEKRSSQRDDFAEAIQTVIASVQENISSNTAVTEQQEQEEGEQEKELKSESPATIVNNNVIQQTESTMKSTQAMRDTENKVNMAVELTTESESKSKSVPSMTENSSLLIEPIEEFISHEEKKKELDNNSNKYEDDYETISNPRSRSCSVQNNPLDSPLRANQKTLSTPDRLEVSSTALTPPYTPITPHGMMTSLHDHDGLLDGNSMQSNVSTSLERSEAIKAIVSLPLLPIQEEQQQQQFEGGSSRPMIEEKKSLDVNQAREARKSVMLLQEMLNKDAISLRQSIQLSTDDEFWSKLENSLNIASPEK